MNDKKYKVLIDRKAQKELSKLDPFVSKKIIKWIETNLKECDNPYRAGIQLCGTLAKYWRYRVGDYRLIAEINDEKIIILIVKIGHRRGIYN